MPLQWGRLSLAHGTVQETDLWRSLWCQLPSQYERHGNVAQIEESEVGTAELS